MPDITISIAPNATGTVTIEDTPTPVAGANIDLARQEAMQHATAHARRTGRPATITAHDPSGTFYLTVQPDGNITDRPAPPAASGPGWEQHPAPIVTEVPGAQPSPDLDATRPRQVTPAQVATTAPAVAPTDSAVASTAPQPSQESDPATTAPAPAPQPDPVESDPRWTEIAQRPATQGFRGTLNGMGFKLSPTEDELEERRKALRQDLAREEQERLADQERARTEAAQAGRRAAREREQAERERQQRALIQTNFEDSMTVSFMNEKGGVGKTTDTYCVGATFGRIRGGDVIAWDANETRGTLGFRAQKDRHSRSVVDLLEEAAAEFGTVEGSRRSTIMRYTRNQGDNQFGVIASDESRDRQDLVDGDGFRTVHEILGRFHSLVLIDTGNNHRVSHFKAALDATDQLVIPVSAGADGAYAAEVMMDNFISLGRADLVKNAVVLLHDSATRSGDAGAVAERFRSRVRAIIPIPFDPSLDSGDEIDFDTLQPATRAAYQEAAAAIAEGLATLTRKAA